MKSFKKLRDFARQQGGKSSSSSKEKQQQQDGGGSGNDYHHLVGAGYVEPTPDAELIVQGMQYVRGAQRKYEMLVTLSAEVSNRAHDLSTAVHDMASYFAAQEVLDDQFHDIGRVFQHVGRVQDEISKSLELYASHVTQTVTSPTEDLILELQNVLETKKLYDMKRQSMDFHQTRIARGRLKTGRVNSQADEMLEGVREEFEELGRLLGDQIFSLQQGRTEKLIPQAARHHAAQMKLFSKGLTSLHDIEPHIKQITRELNIDRRLSSTDMDEYDLEEDDDGDVDVASYTEVIDDDESYFDNGDDDMEHHHHSRNHSRNHSRSHSRDDYLGGSGSFSNGPLHTSREWSSYMASTSDNTGILRNNTGTLRNEGFDSPLPQWMMKVSKSTPTSPLPPGALAYQPTNSPPHPPPPPPPRTPTPPTTKPTLFDHSVTIRPMPLPLPLDTNTKKRYSYSGPLTSSAKPCRIPNHGVPSSGPLTGGKSRQPLSPTSSTPTTSPPQIFELHKLPPPPLSASSSPIASGMVPHSGPLHTKHLPSKTWT